jgi:hypothetical protein
VAARALQLIHPVDHVGDALFIAQDARSEFDEAKRRGVEHHQAAVDLISGQLLVAVDDPQRQVGRNPVGIAEVAVAGAEARITEIVNAVERPRGEVEGHVPAMAVEIAEDQLIALDPELAIGGDDPAGPALVSARQLGHGAREDFVGAHPRIHRHRADLLHTGERQLVQLRIKLRHPHGQRVAGALPQHQVIVGKQLFARDGAMLGKRLLTVIEHRLRQRHGDARAEEIEQRHLAPQPLGGIGVARKLEDQPVILERHRVPALGKRDELSPRQVRQPRDDQGTVTRKIRAFRLQMQHGFLADFRSRSLAGSRRNAIQARCNSGMLCCGCTGWKAAGERGL